MERAFTFAKSWLLGGNTVARVGILVLFVGVGFLLRYVSSQVHVPIELRLLGVALAGLAFLALGWRLREKRRGFGITLQGGAIGLLYLTSFAALRLYAVLPPLAAFAFMAMLAALACTLAILQDARALASLGAVGGFLAPLLISTGSGRIELLFSYYLVLDAGVLAIAWFRAWRELNWIGFVLTFGVSGLWAVQRYAPADFVVAQTFLALFWLLYLGVSMLFALHLQRSENAEWRGRFDTTLVFALPLAALSIQGELTEGGDLALASAIAAAVYVGLSFWLQRQHVERGASQLRLLAESHFGIGIALFTLSIPLATDAHWTSLSWPLEGLALAWIGLRERRLLPLAAGPLLHVLGAFALTYALASGELSLDAGWSGVTLNLLVLSGTALVMTGLLERAARAELLSPELGAQAVWIGRLIGWIWAIALVWQPLAEPYYGFTWAALGLGLIVFDRRSDESYTLPPEWTAGAAALLFAGVASTRGVGFELEGIKLLLQLTVAASMITAAVHTLRATSQLQRRSAGVGLVLGVLAGLSAVRIEPGPGVHDALAVAQLSLAGVVAAAFALDWLSARLGWSWPRALAWSAFAAHIVLGAYGFASALLFAMTPSMHHGAWLWPLLWMSYYVRLYLDERGRIETPVRAALHVAGLWLLTAMLASELSLRIVANAGNAWPYTACGLTIAAALWLCVKYAQSWPMRSAPEAYARVGVPGVALAALAWIVLANLASSGDPRPLVALPVLNPLDLTSLTVLASLLYWHARGTRVASDRDVRALLGAAALYVVSMVALRGTHFMTGVAWTTSALGASATAQAVLALVWTLSALLAMWTAHQRRQRLLWGAGAGLLAVVVIKLFLLDLDGQGTIGRIVSFIGVGLLLLVIGYLAPVPPTAVIVSDGSKGASDGPPR